MSIETLKSIAIDWGSTDVKIAHIFEDGSWKEIPWFGYVAENRLVNPNGDKVSVLSGETLSQLTSEILKCVQGNHSEGICLTGAKNPLWVRYGDEDWIIFDDPSPLAPLPPEKMAIINRAFGTDLSDIEHSSGLYKLIQLQTDPKYRQAVFGQDVDFNDLQFGSVNGYVATQITHNKYSYFESDIGGLSVNGGTKEQTKQCLSELGLKATACSVDLDPEGFLIMDDFSAESQLIQSLFKTKAIDHDAFIIAWDSVVKILSANNLFLKQKNGLTYVTQRNGARTNKDGAQIKQMDIHDFYVYIDQLLLSQYPSVDWHYDPDNGGALYHNANGIWELVPMNYQHLGQLSSQEIDKLLLAMAYGVVCGAYSKIDEVSAGNPKTLINMGGWTALNRHGKQHGRLLVMRRLAGQADRISKLNLPSAGIAIGLIYLIQHDSTIDLLSILGGLKEIGDGVGGNDLYLSWWIGQKEVIIQQNKHPYFYLPQS